MLVGVFLRDILLDVVELALDSKCRTTGRKVRPGGNCTNTAAALSSLGRSGSSTAAVTTWLHARLGCAGDGDEAFATNAAKAGDFALLADKSIENELSTCYCIRDKATGSRTIIRHGDASEPTAESLGRALRTAVS